MSLNESQLKTIQNDEDFKEPLNETTPIINSLTSAFLESITLKRDRLNKSVEFGTKVPSTHNARSSLGSISKLGLNKNGSSINLDLDRLLKKNMPIPSIKAVSNIYQSRNFKARYPENKRAVMTLDDVIDVQLIKATE